MATAAGEAGAKPGSRWHLPHLAPLVGVAVVALAAYVIHRVSAEVHLADIEAALAATPLRSILLGLLLTATSFLAMSLYDVLGAEQVAPGRVPKAIAAFAGAASFAVANAVGFHVLTGVPIRYRLYAGAGLDMAQVGHIVGNALVAFWLGVATLLGAAMLIDPVGVPLLDRLDPRLDRVLGAVILAVIAGMVLWLGRNPRTLALFGWRLVLPGAAGMLARIGLGVVDVGCAAAALYVLLPADVQPGYAVFLLVFLTAIVAGAASHVPGGLGVLEATVLVGLGAGTNPDVIAALVVFRVLYYLLPLALAGLTLALFEARRGLAPVAGKALRVGRPLVPPLAAGLVFMGGIVLLLTGNLPAEGSRLDRLGHLLPLPFAEASHMAASLVGLLLIVLARGLLARMALARTAAIALLLAGAVFALLRGLDWEEALLLAVIAGLLVLYRDAFYRGGDWRRFRPTPGWLALVLVTLVALTLVGFLAFRHVEYREDLWWDFAWDGDAPRFLRVSLLLAVAAAALALDALLRRPAPLPAASEPIPDAVRRLLDACPDTQPQLGLLGDKRFLVSDEGDAFLMYAVAGRSWVAFGDPVGNPEAGRELVWRLAELADRAAGRPVFYALSPDLLPLYLDLGLAILKTGEVAAVNLRGFSLAGKRRQDFRQALRRAERERITFDIVPKADVPELLPELKTVSDAWLAIKAGHEKGFSLGRFDERYLAEFDCAVLRQGGRVVAFANLLHGADRHELSVDLMRYRPDVTKGLMDMLFARIMLHGQKAGYQWFSLGAAPLAGLADHPLASTWNRVGTLVYRRGDEFYNFAGLRAFKQKFDPTWTPQYLACHGGLGLPSVLMDIATLIAGSRAGLIRR
jgi:phosphatidylglycerol lysyltransferase